MISDDVKERLSLKPHEEPFELRPVGIRYICEFCNEGEMKVDPNRPGETLTSNPPQYRIPHVCTKCGKTMILPKSYPYLEWLPITDDDK